MVLYSYNSLSSSIRKYIYLLFLFLSPSLSLNVLTYPFILGNIKTNGLITASKHPIKYLEIFFVSTNFEFCYEHENPNFLSVSSHYNFFYHFCLTKISTLLYYQKNWSHYFFTLMIGAFL